MLAIALLGIFGVVIAKQTYAAPMSMPFGGKVIMNTIPGIICVPPGMGPVVTSQNVGGLATAALVGGNSNYSTGVRAGGIVMGLYSTIPFYTTDPTKVTRPGGYILGRHLMVPDFATCRVGQYPFPIMKTTTYGVSR